MKSLNQDFITDNTFYKTLIIRNFDTLIISGCNSSVLFNVLSLVNKFLCSRGVFLDDKLLDLRSIYQGLDFIYWRFIKMYDDFLLINISSSFLRDYKLKLKLIVKNSYSMSVVNFIFLLNKQISDWVLFSFSVSNSCNLGFVMDFYLYKLLWKWARRRHPRRPNTWIYSKYWKFIYGKWNFFVLNPATGHFLFLKSHSSFGFKVYYLPFSLNVFSLLNENKVNSLLFKKFSYKLNGIYYFLWKKQCGLCASCRTFLFINDFSSLKLFRCSSFSKDSLFNKISGFVLLHKYCSYKF